MYLRKRGKKWYYTIEVLTEDGQEGSVWNASAVLRMPRRRKPIARP